MFSSKPLTFVVTQRNFLREFPSAANYYLHINSHAGELNKHIHNVKLSPTCATKNGSNKTFDTFRILKTEDIYTLVTV